MWSINFAFLYWTTFAICWLTKKMINLFSHLHCASVLLSLWKTNNINILFWNPLTKSLCGSPDICQVGVLPNFFTAGNVQSVSNSIVFFSAWVSVFIDMTKGEKVHVGFEENASYLSLSTTVRSIRKVRSLKHRKYWN